MAIKFQKEPMNAHSSIKHVIGVVSGKGGVGKSFVTASMAAAMRKKGYEVGIMDADITGPSIPKMYGIHGKAVGDGKEILPAMAEIWNEVVEDGIAFPQLNLLDENSGAEFFGSQTYCAVAENTESHEILGLYILHPNNVGKKFTYR